MSPEEDSLSAGDVRFPRGHHSRPFSLLGNENYIASLADIPGV